MRRNVLFIILCLAVILCAIIFAGYSFWLNTKKIENDISNKKFENYIHENYLFDSKVENFIIDAVGKEYFKENYKFIRSWEDPGHSLEMSISGPNPSTYIPVTRIYEYEFLPFSGKYKYLVYGSIDLSEDGYGYFSGEYLVPECARDAEPNRCTYKINYSQIYDIAQGVFGKNNIIHIGITKMDDNYKWYARKEDIYHDQYYYIIEIDPETGTTTPIRKIGNLLFY